MRFIPVKIRYKKGSKSTIFLSKKKKKNQNKIDFKINENLGV